MLEVFAVDVAVMELEVSCLQVILKSSDYSILLHLHILEVFLSASEVDDDLVVVLLEAGEFSLGGLQFALKRLDY